MGNTEDNLDGAAAAAGLEVMCIGDNIRSCPDYYPDLACRN